MIVDGRGKRRGWEMNIYFVYASYYRVPNHRKKAKWPIPPFGRKLSIIEKTMVE